MFSALVSVPDLGFLIFPAVLLAYYAVCWAIAGKDPKIENVAPQYEPPAGVSPGVARYIITGGSDGTTLAAVLANLAAEGVISIQPQEKTYRLELLQEKIASGGRGRSGSCTLQSGDAGQDCSRRDATPSAAHS